MVMTITVFVIICILNTGTNSLNLVMFTQLYEFINVLYINELWIKIWTLIIRISYCLFEYFKFFLVFFLLSICRLLKMSYLEGSLIKISYFSTFLSLKQLLICIFSVFNSRKWTFLVFVNFRIALFRII